MDNWCDRFNMLSLDRCPEFTSARPKGLGSLAWVCILQRSPTNYNPNPNPNPNHSPNRTATEFP